MSTHCANCGRVIPVGESAWASEWKVIGTDGTEAEFRTEWRYTCDDCEATQ